MGSGHFFQELQGKEASFKHIQYINSHGGAYDPVHSDQHAIEDKPECYNVGPFYDSKSHGGNDGYIFYFGGPGGCNN